MREKCASRIGVESRITEAFSIDDVAIVAYSFGMGLAVGDRNPDFSKARVHCQLANGN